MSKNVVSLTVHRNTRLRKQRKELRADMVMAARTMASREDIAGFVLIGIGRNGAAYAAWDTGRAVPIWAVPSFVGEAIRTEVNNWLSEHNGKDDFDPAG